MEPNGATHDAQGEPASDGSSVATGLRTFVMNNWRVALYVLLIVLCVLFAPEQPLKFIYTEF